VVPKERIKLFLGSFSHKDRPLETLGSLCIGECQEEMNLQMVQYCAALQEKEEVEF